MLVCKLRVVRGGVRVELTVKGNRKVGDASPGLGEWVTATGQTRRVSARRGGDPVTLPNPKLYQDKEVGWQEWL